MEEDEAEQDTRGYADAEEFANTFNAEYWETSAKTGENVTEFFQRVAVVLWENAIAKVSHQETEKNITSPPLTDIGKLPETSTTSKCGPSCINR